MEFVKEAATYSAQVGDMHYRMAWQLGIGVSVVRIDMRVPISQLVAKDKRTGEPFWYTDRPSAMYLPEAYQFPDEEAAEKWITDNQLAN